MINEKVLLKIDTEEKEDVEERMDIEAVQEKGRV